MEDIGQLALSISVPAVVGLVAVQIIEVNLPVTVGYARHVDDPTGTACFQFIQEEFRQQKMT